MRGDASTKRFPARLDRLGGLLRGLLVMSAAGLATVTMTSCDPFGLKDDDQAAQLANLKGHAAVVWTLNGTPLTVESCKAERITSMNVFVASKQNRDEAVEFLNVTCELDRYSMAMIPSGPVRVFVDAIKESSSKDPCVRYSAQVDVTAGSSFPSQATPMPLKFVANCP